MIINRMVFTATVIACDVMNGNSGGGNEMGVSLFQ